MEKLKILFGEVDFFICLTSGQYTLVQGSQFGAKAVGITQARSERPKSFADWYFKAGLPSTVWPRVDLLSFTDQLRPVYCCC